MMNSIGLVEVKNISKGIASGYAFFGGKMTVKFKIASF